MKRALFSLALLLSLSATVGGFSAQAGDGTTPASTTTASTTSTTGGDSDRPRNPLIKADIQALKAARKQLKDDRENNDVDRLTADRDAVKAAFKKLREDIAALRKDRKPDA